MRFMHTFGCPVFALNNSLASNKAIPRLDPRECIGLNLGPNPMHTRNVQLVLSLTTGLVSPQFHIRFDDFFETCKYGVTDAGLSSTWQHLAGFKQEKNELVLHTSNGLLGQAPILHASVRPASQVTTEPNTVLFPEFFDSDTVTSQFYEEGSINFSDTPPPVTRQGSHVTSEASHLTCQAQHLSVTQGNCSRGPRSSTLRVVPTPTPTAPPAGTSLRGHTRTMSRTMAQSIDQRSYFGSSGMHYMSACATATTGDDDGQTMEDHQHDAHLSLQDRKSNPITFHSEMMGDIMYLNQALRQPDAAHFVKAVITEINGHVGNKKWQLTKQSEVPPDTDVLPSVWSLRHKRDITSNEIKKYKAHLNLHGGK